VTAGGAALPLLYVSSGQVNALLPLGTTGSTAVTNADGTVSQKIDFIVTTAEGSSAAFSATLSGFAPALFSLDASGMGKAIAANSKLEVVESLAPGEVVYLYATGLGAVDGEGKCVTQPKVRIGGKKIDAQSAAVTDVPGVYQVSAVIPSQLDTDEIAVVVPSETEIADPFQALSLPLKASDNAVSAVATIQTVYPGDGAQVDLSPVAWVGKLGLSFTVPAGAKSFNVVVKLRHGGQTVASIAVDPATETAKVVAHVPTAAQRAGDFSASAYTAIDLLSGMALPGNRMPISRLRVDAVTALKLVPQPNADSGSYETTLPVKVGTKFVFPTDTMALATYFDVPAAATGGSVYDEVVVYVDGREAASEEFSVEVL
jgi:uncharacterized protein (TIGR03437 family)